MREIPDDELELEAILELLDNYVWSRICEGNWRDRLNELKNKLLETKGASQ